MPGIKISGITNTEDARWAAILGVEFISFSLVEGDPKKVSPDMASQISAMLPSYTSVILETDGPGRVRPSVLEKVKPAYLEFPPAPGEEENESEGSNENIRVLVLPDLSGTGGEILPVFTEIGLSGPLTPENSMMIKEKFNPEKLILAGDFELPVIKKICEDIQPYAWSVRDVIGKSPRKIEYGKMKEYIREITLW